MGVGGPGGGENWIAESAQPGAQIEKEILIPAGDDLDAAGVAAKGAPDREGQLAVDKAVDRLRSGQIAVAGGEQRVADFRPHLAVPKRPRHRAAGSPEAHVDGRAKARV